MSAAYNPTRIATGLAMLVPLGLTLYFGGVILLGLTLLVSTLGQWEFYALFREDDAPLPGRIPATILGGGLLCATWFCPASTLPALGASFVILALVFLFSWAADNSRHFSHVAILAAGILYVPLLLSPVLSMGTIEQVFLLCAAIASDTAAYFAGSCWGKHKIWPQVSPAKSVEGSAAGLLACVSICVLLGLIFGIAPVQHFALLGVLLGVLAQLGDFFESSLKRSAHVKDTGSLLPGHGGVLDRADSLLFVFTGYALCKTFWTFF